MFKLHSGPEPKGPDRNALLLQAALRRRAGDLRAARFATGLRRMLPARLAAVRLAGRRGAFFFAIFAMVGSLFLFPS
jgi:hypothetical protein